MQSSSGVRGDNRNGPESRRHAKLETARFVARLIEPLGTCLLSVFWRDGHTSEVQVFGDRREQYGKQASDGARVPVDRPRECVSWQSDSIGMLIAIGVAISRSCKFSGRILSGTKINQRLSFSRRINELKWKNLAARLCRGDGFARANERDEQVASVSRRRHICSERPVL